MTEIHQQVIRRGMLLDDEQILPATIKTISEKSNEFLIEMTIIEGKNRQVRRMCEELGYTVLELTRTKIGSYDILMMQNKIWKLLSSEDVNLLIGKDKKEKGARTNSRTNKTQSVPSVLPKGVATKKRKKKSYGRMR